MTNKQCASENASNNGGFGLPHRRLGDQVSIQRAFSLNGSAALVLFLAGLCITVSWTSFAAEKELAIPTNAPNALGHPELPPEPEEEEEEEERGLGVGRDSPDFERPIDRRARLIRVEPAQFPEELKGTGMAADIQLSVVVDRTGRASHIRVEDSPDETFTAAALDAVSQWEWQPAVKRGKLSNERIPISVPVSEEHGDLAVFDFKGGRVALEDTAYGTEVDTPIHRRFGVRPVYPFMMLAGGKPGEVVVEFIVGEGGVPSDMNIVESTHREFGYAALGAFAQWKYEPAQFRGRVVPARLRYRVSFQAGEFDAETMRMAVGLRDENLPELVSVREIDRQPRAAKVFYPPKLVSGDDTPQRHKVRVSLLVTPQGDAMFPQVVSSPDPLAGYIALAAVQYWKFTPAIKKRQPVYVHLTFPIAF